MGFLEDKQKVAAYDNMQMQNMAQYVGKQAYDKGKVDSENELAQYLNQSVYAPQGAMQGDRGLAQSYGPVDNSSYASVGNGMDQTQVDLINMIKTAPRDKAIAASQFARTGGEGGTPILTDEQIGLAAQAREGR